MAKSTSVVALVALLSTIGVGLASSGAVPADAPNPLADALREVQTPSLARVLQTAGLPLNLDMASTEAPGPVPASSSDLLLAVSRLASIRGVPWKADEGIPMERFAQTLTPEQRGSLAQALRAYADVETLTQAIFGGLAGRLPSNADLLPLVESRAVLLQAGVALEAAFPQAEPSLMLGPGDPDVNIPGVLVLDVSPCGDSVYGVDYALLIDVCGDDVYNNNAGASFNPLVPQCERVHVLEEPEQVHVAFAASAALFDMAGSDQYGNGHRPCGANGGGTLASGFLLDAGAQNAFGAADVYRADRVAVNGGAHFGVGFLLDVDGPSTYYAAGQGANGGAYVTGFGGLLDLGGDDTYSVIDDLFGGDDGKAANGGGFLAGVGFLLDRGVDDESFTDAETFNCLTPPPAETCMMMPVPFDDGFGLRLDWP